jgi:signal peptidase II
MQAARGASLNPSDSVDHDPDHDPGHASGGRRLDARLLFAGVALVAYAVDLGSKQWALSALADGDVPVLGDWLTLHLTFNPGAAFSTGTDFTIVFTVLAMVAVCVVLWFSRRVGSTGWALALGFLLGGVSGNLTDRLVRDPEPLHGHVVDFLMLPHWPVFNVADMCINVAAALIILQTFRGIRLDGSRESAEPGE